MQAVLPLALALSLSAPALAARPPSIDQPLETGDRARKDTAVLISMEDYSFLPDLPGVKADTDADNAAWFAVGSLPPLAFDHRSILAAALDRLRDKVRREPVAFKFLPRKFTLTQLQRFYEAVLGETLDKRNFRRRILAMEILADAGRQENVPHRAAALYRFDKRAYDRAVRDGFNFEV